MFGREILFYLFLLLKTDCINAFSIEMPTSYDIGIDSEVFSDSVLFSDDSISTFSYCSDSSLVSVGDTLFNVEMPTKLKWYDTKLFRYTHFPVSLLILGGIEKHFDKKTRQLRNDFLPSFHNETDNYLQVAPVFVLYGMKAFGVKSKSSLGRMVVSHAASVAFMFPLTRGLKSLFKVQRPDSSKPNSFPSGHTTTAFMTATMLHKEYGYISPWVTVGAYSCATATGLMRMANNRHWYSDVLCGAGIGMLTTEFGYWMGDLMFKDRGLNVPETRRNHFDKYDNPSFISFYSGINIAINKKFTSSSGNVYTPTAGQSFGLEGAYYFSPYLGMGAKLSCTNIDLADDYESHSEDYAVRYGQIMTGIYGNLPLTDRFSLCSKLLIGHTHFKKVESENYDFNSLSVACANTELGMTYKLDTHLATRFSFNYNIFNTRRLTNTRFAHTLSVGGNLILQL